MATLLWKASIAAFNRLRLVILTVFTAAATTASLFTMAYFGGDGPGVITSTFIAAIAGALAVLLARAAIEAGINNLKLTLYENPPRAVCVSTEQEKTNVRIMRVFLEHRTPLSRLDDSTFYSISPFIVVGTRQNGTGTCVVMCHDKADGKARMIAEIIYSKLEIDKEAS